MNTPSQAGMRDMAKDGVTPHVDLPVEKSPEDFAGKQVFTTGEVARICKVSQQTIIRCFDSGRLTGFRVPGSRFRRIPRAELVRFMKENNIPLENLSETKHRILVVDDDPTIVELFVDVLSRNDRFEVKTAGGGYEAGMLTESFRPHLIILDYMLPDINGNVVCEQIRRKVELADTKIIFVSGVVNPAEVENLMKAGADDFIKKPFNIDKLMARVHSLLGIEVSA